MKLDHQTTYKLVLITAVLFGIIAATGAIHSFLCGYSDIYTAIFIMLGTGFFLIVYILSLIHQE